MYSHMPRDPFADDPDNDPSRFLDAEEADFKLSAQQVQDVRNDLSLLEIFRAQNEDRGFLGIRSFCHSCQASHFFDWDLLELTMHTTINRGIPPVHEFSSLQEKQAHCYLTWEYCLGYLNGADAAGGF